MEGMFGMHSTGEYVEGMSPENLIFPPDYQTLISSSIDTFRFGSDELISSAISEAASITPEIHHHNYNNNNNNNNNNNSNSSNNSNYQAVQDQLQPPLQQQENDNQYWSLIKSKIASHPYYPRLLQAYIDCQKVGAPPEIACLLDEILQENDPLRHLEAASTCLGADPELDEFMETYCDVLVKYKSDLERPFDEATSFLNTIEMQLRNLCTDEGAVSSDEYLSGGEVEAHEAPSSVEDRDLKDKLLRRFGSRISSLKLEFSKKKKKGKLPKEARQTLLDWWNVHYKWPYPTEADKVALAESTGLDQKQINNWFINQRKRHWKPSENMQFAFMNNISGQYFADD